MTFSQNSYLVDRLSGRGRLGRRLAAVALAGAAVGALAPAAVAAPAPAGAEARRGGVDARAELRAFVADGSSTAAFAEVREDGRRIWRDAAGTSDLATGQPARPDGRFRIGSVTKAFVSTVVLQLVGEGRLRLDDPVERHLPGVVPNGGAISVRQLLNHTSGLYDYLEDPRFFYQDDAGLRDYALGDRRWQDYRPEQLVAIGVAHPPYFAPGQGWKYSNTNYILAGLLIDKLTGHSWQSEVTRRIVRPLHLDDTVFPGSETGLRGPHAHAYAKLPEGPADITRLNPTVGGAAGNGISTTTDLDRFHAALFGGKLLRPAEQAALTTTVPTGSGHSAYGLGVAEADLGCGPLWGHDGGLPGWGTLMFGTADGKRQVALSYNPYEGTDQSGLNAAVVTLAVKTLCGTTPAGAAADALSALRGAGR
ncbi:serine hydrolase domain-containing protein [Kitasatospora purpeofusca]|uniref:serine hydrolase domain-containing protein n=1 Tax=Kitasatospora purpeofusca TaxID=67352 RepID=UPI002A59EFC2|nr:serine hydrolase domain-containing protein [Kitasatospora purpeofusca]MDY0810296.1 serine hydrolase domain-containing protein [Kitasatospora purpeofusca]